MRLTPGGRGSQCLDKLPEIPLRRYPAALEAEGAEWPDRCYQTQEGLGRLPRLLEGFLFQEAPMLRVFLDITALGAQHY